MWVLLSLPLAGQELPDVERLLEANDIPLTEEGYGELVATLLQLAASPLDVNTAGFDSLKMLFLLSDSQIDRLMRFREQHGGFRHLNELLLVPGIGRKDFENILPFVSLGGEWRQGMAVPARRVRQQLLARMKTSRPLQEGYTFYSPYDFDKKKDYERKVASRFHGPPFGTLVKYRLKAGNRVQAGVTLENDAGEGYFTRHQRAGFDFVSAHLGITGEGRLKRLLLGDYRVQWGQGLVAWGGFASGKSDVAVGMEKSARGIAPYASADENNFLRGAALSVEPCRHLTADLFVSAKKTDGNLTQADTLQEEDWLSVSLYESGYHRNDAECRKKDALREWTTGLSLQWNAAPFRVGVNALYYDFTPALIPGGNLYQQYNDTGERRFLMSVDYKTAFRRVYLFGETAWCERNAWATLNGLRWNNAFLSACLLYRRYDRRYVSRYASGFGEYANTSNEEGVYVGVEWAVAKDWKVNAYADRFRFFSARYGAREPGAGWEVCGEVRYDRPRWEHSFRVKHEARPEDLKGKGSVQRKKTECRYQANVRCCPPLELRTRLTGMLYHKGGKRETGYMVYQDAIWDCPPAALKMQYRLAWFDTDSYQSRIYAYENNVLYAYSFPMFMGKGVRTYLNLSWKPVPLLTCYLKAGMVAYPERETISSGVTEVKGNKLYDFTFQVRLVF